MGTDDQCFQPCGPRCGKCGGIGGVDIARDRERGAIGTLHQIQQNGTVPRPRHLGQFSQMFCPARSDAIGEFHQAWADFTST